MKMTSQLDIDGRYYARINQDGILKIWNTASNSLEQEYVPDIHLASPCTCLQFVESIQNSSESISPRKKKKKLESSREIVLGTTSGKLLIYSIAKGDIKCTINGNINSPVSCLSPNVGEIIYSGVDKNVVVWNIRQRKLFCEWKAGNDKISAILAIPRSEKLLTASKCIKLWNYKDRTVLKTFSGHSSNVNFLHYIPNFNSDELKYILSGSMGDRVMNCWNISEDVQDVHATASLLSEDYVNSISLNISENGLTKLSATLANGAVHIFEVILNGRCVKPIKPKSTIKVVADTGQRKDAIIPILIFSSYLRNENTLLIAHGSYIVLTFEELELNNKKLVCLTRQHPHTQKQNGLQPDKIIQLEGNNATYLTPYSNVSAVTKRKLGAIPELTMERRLENLSFDKDGSVPRGNNMAHLLLQGLRSKDNNIIRTVLRTKNEHIVRNTLKRLPINVITQLVQQLGNFIRGNDTQARSATVWLKNLLDVHTALLMSNPELPIIFAPISNYIKNRLAALHESKCFKVKLDSVLSEQVTKPTNNDEEDEDAPIFNDRDSSSDTDEEPMDMSDEESEMDVDSMEDELSN